MYTINENKDGAVRKYSAPKIEIIVLDNNISLALESASEPDGEPVWTYNATGNFSQSPFKA